MDRLHASLESNGAEEMVEKTTAYDGEEPGGLSRHWGPGLVDSALRDAICQCWLVMPPSKRTPHDVEAEIRRVIDRAMKDLHDDARAFGVEDE